MKITKRFQEAVLKAKEKGYNEVIVSKTKNFGNYAVVYLPFEDVLNAEIGTNIDTGREGVFESKANTLHKDGIFYQNIFRFYAKK